MPEIRMPYEPDPDVDPGRRERVEAVVAAYEAMMHRVALAHAPEFLGVGVTMSQAKVMYLVQARPDVRMSEIAARLGVSLSTLSGMLERLVEHGLLERHDDPTDRRQVRVRITDAGTRELELFRELNARQLRSLVTRIADDDLAVVKRALDILIATIPDLPPTGAPVAVPHATEGASR